MTEVYRLLDSKARWVNSQLEKTAQVAELKLIGEAGDSIYYLGQPLSLQFRPTEQHGIIIDKVEGEFLIEHRGEQPNQLATVRKIRKQLRNEADNLLPATVAIWSERMDLKPAVVRVKQYKARWGSCSKNGEVQLNWQLIGASQAVIDYVVVHELAHLKYFNHSATFWSLVEKFQPNYKVQKMWLKEYGPYLML